MFETTCLNEIIKDIFRNRKYSLRYSANDSLAEVTVQKRKFSSVKIGFEELKSFY